MLGVGEERSHFVLTFFFLFFSFLFFSGVREFLLPFLPLMMSGV